MGREDNHGGDRDLILRGIILAGDLILRGIVLAGDLIMQEMRKIIT